MQSSRLVYLHKDLVRGSEKVLTYPLSQREELGLRKETGPHPGGVETKPIFYFLQVSSLLLSPFPIPATQLKCTEQLSHPPKWHPRCGLTAVSDLERRSQEMLVKEGESGGPAAV